MKLKHKRSSVKDSLIRCRALLPLQVQSKVNLKYDSWHKEVLSKFGQMLGSNMTEFHSQISKVRWQDPAGVVDSPAPLGPLLNAVLSPDSPARSWNNTQ